MADPVTLEFRLAIDGTDYFISRIETHEATDEISTITCELDDHAGGPAPGALIDKQLTLTVSRADGADERKIAATVVLAERGTPRGDEVPVTRVVARPRLFRLTQRADCRTFQNMSAVDIVKKVLVGAGIPETAQSWKTSGTYSPRVYTSQYRESDFAFVERLMSEEGISFTFDSSSDPDVVVFFDGDLGAVDGTKAIPYLLGSGLLAGGDAIGELTHQKRTAPGRVNLRDYDFTKPRFNLDAKAKGDDAAEASLEVYVYPGRFTEESDGDRLAQVLMDELRARREVVTGVANTPRLVPGRRFDLQGHPYSPLDQEYRIVGVDLRYDLGTGARPDGSPDSTGERDVSSVRFSAIPTAKTTYRPPRVARAVAAPGAQVAVVTGPAGQEIHPDDHGRVKVQFAWDRLGKKDDTSSLWIRTCQLPLGGSMLTPRVGWEASLNFVDGDPDQPFVFGRMYNAKTPPPYPLPENKTRSSIQTATTPGGGSTNEIRTDDKAGSEQMFMNASKDQAVSAGNNATESVGNNETRSIGADQKLADTDSMSASIGASQTLSVSGNQTINVGTALLEEIGGSQSLTVGGNRDLKAGGDHKRGVTGGSTLSIGGMQIDLVAGSVDESCLATMDDKVSAVLVELTASDRTVTVTGARTENAGAAKIILTGGGRAVTVGGALSQKVAGAIGTIIKGDRADTSSADFLEVAGGAQIMKATNVVFEAQDLLSVVMGASTITLTPASVSIAGTKITIDGECDETAALVVDNG